MLKFFMESWQKCKSQETFNIISEVKSFLEDKESRNILETRINIYESGNINLFNNILTKNEQYFDKEIITLSEEEIFLDLGAYTGDTIRSFINRVNNNYKKIIGFEPDHKTMLSLNRYILKNNINKIIIYKLATWNKEDTLNFNEDNSFISQIDENGTSSINANSLDNILYDICPVTFIKMDVEGAEPETIEGAKKLIKKYKPKLAICVYHRANHIYEIPYTIKKLVPEYKLYLRHYSDSFLDTVLYATL